MGKLAEDEFQTFIFPKDDIERGLDLQRMMISVVEGFNFTPSQFWEMPMNLVLELLGLFRLPVKKPMSRKQLIDNERHWNKLNGI
jgi:hypothetical protein